MLVFINNVYVRQSADSISANANDDIRIYNPDGVYPQLGRASASSTSIGYIKEIVEIFPKMHSPANSAIPASDFSYTFYACQSLVSVPGYLFSNNPDDALDYYPDPSDAAMMALFHTFTDGGSTGSKGTRNTFYYICLNDYDLLQNVKVGDQWKAAFFTEEPYWGTFTGSNDWYEHPIS